jgi:hypothetical protein
MDEIKLKMDQVKRHGCRMYLESAISKGMVTRQQIVAYVVNALIESEINNGGILSEVIQEYEDKGAIPKASGPVMEVIVEEASELDLSDIVVDPVVDDDDIDISLVM